jgi:hypothetical protein
MIRLRITTVYSTNPVLDEVTIEDLVTATVGSVRTIVPVAAAPFGTFAGGSLFGAPGVALTTSNLIAADVQAFQLIDDNGVTQIPPNTISITQSTLVSGDSIAVYRRTGADINKTQFTLTTGNNLGNTTVVMGSSIPTDNPSSAGSKLRLISASNQEHRYRIASYTSATYTLAAASTGTDGGTGTLTSIIDGSATFQTDNVEPGDFVRNTTDGVSFSVVVTIVSETELTVTNNGVAWTSQAYSVNTLVENYTSGQNAYAPLMERIADAATETNSLVFASSFDIRAVVRRSSLSNPILAFTQDTTLAGTLDIPTTRNSDDIIT